MKAAKRKTAQTSRTAEILLKELREECERVVALIRRLEKGAASGLIGELSAAILHLHSHTAGLDEFLCEME